MSLRELTGENGLNFKRGGRRLCRTMNHDGHVNPNYGGQRKLAISKNMVRPRRTRLLDVANAMKRRIFSDYLNRNPF